MGFGGAIYSQPIVSLPEWIGKMAGRISWDQP